MKALHAFALLSLLLQPAPVYPGVSDGQSLALSWNAVALQVAHHAKFDSPIEARSLAIVHTCVYDAWAAYGEKAIGTQLGGALRRPASERTTANKEKAISYAAYRALSDLFPTDKDSVFKPLMKQLGYDPNDNSTDIETPAGIGNVACSAVLEFRHHDKSNQLGDLSRGPYSDWTHFRPVNMPAAFPVRLPSTHPVDMNHWQPLIFVNATGSLMTQMFTEAHWCYVTPFALASSDEFRTIAKDLPPPAYGSAVYRQQAEELVRLSAGLTDEHKMLAEYWSGALDSASISTRWNEVAEWMSARDHHLLDDDVKMFFALNNALYPLVFAAGAVAVERWLAKRFWLKAGVAAMVVLGTLPAVPLVTWMLSPDQCVSYQAALGVKPSKTEVSMQSLWPQAAADQFGWPQLVDQVAEIYSSVPPDQRAKTGIWAGNYGGAGAINFWGPRYGLPTAYSRHQNHWYWGPPPIKYENLILIEWGRDDVRDNCTSYQAFPHYEKWGMGWENTPIYLCRGVKFDIQKIWWHSHNWN